MFERDRDTFEPIAKLLKEARKYYPDKTATDKDLFEDIFTHGALHEEEPDWPVIAGSLSRIHLCHLAVLGIKGLARSGDDAQLEAAMRLYEAVSKWHGGKLDSQDELLGCLDEVRGMLFTNLKRHFSPYFMELIRLFSLADMGVRCEFSNKSWNLGWLTRDYERAFHDSAHGLNPETR